MKKSLKKSLIYLIMTMLVMPTWLVTGMMNAQHAKAAEEVSATDYVSTADTTAPYVLDISSTSADGVYGVGQAVYITVTFSEKVYVTGVPHLRMKTNNPISQYAVNPSVIDSNIITFIYPIAQGDNIDKLNYAATNALTSNGGSIKDYANNEAIYTLPALSDSHSLASNKNISLDTTAPSDQSALVYDGTLTGEESYVTGSHTKLSANWDGFSDNIAIDHYLYAIGNASNVTNFLDWQSTLNKSVTESLNLVNNGYYIFAVKAVDKVGLESPTKFSQGQSVDWNAPVIEPIADQSTTVELSVVIATDNFEKSYKMVQVDGPGELVFTSDPMDPAVIKIKANINGVYTVEAIVTDEAGNYSTTQFHFTWNAESNLSAKNFNINIPTNSDGDATINVPIDVNNGTISFTVAGASLDPKTVTTAGKITINSKTTSGDVTIEIPAGTTITGPADWDGKINLPSLLEKSLVTIKNSDGIVSTIENVLEIGFGDKVLTFDAPVKITFVGQKDKNVGYVKDGVFVSISDCTTLPIATGECKAIENTNDLVVYTMHFTKFATYTQAIVTAPKFTATPITTNGVKKVHFEWKGTGADSYIIKLGGIEIPVEASANDLGMTYTRNITVSDYGTYTVSMIAVKSSVRSINNATSSVTLSASAPVATVVPTPAPVSTSLAPSPAQAAAPTAPAVTNANTNGDENGQIKGDDTSTTEKTNWTPWIVLFVLIILAGAATGGYFYWFAGEDEVAAVVKEPKKEIASQKVVTTVKTKQNNNKPNKKAKRW